MYSINWRNLNDLKFKLISGFLEKCVTVFLDGNSKQSRNHENYTLETNPRPINKTFAQEIEEKYFQIPSTSNVPETKPSRRGSLRAFQVFMNNRLSVVYNIKMFIYVP